MSLKETKHRYTQKKCLLFATFHDMCNFEAFKPIFICTYHLFAVEVYRKDAKFTAPKKIERFPSSTVFSVCVQNNKGMWTWTTKGSLVTKIPTPHYTVCLLCIPLSGGILYCRLKTFPRIGKIWNLSCIMNGKDKYNFRPNIGPIATFLQFLDNKWHFICSENTTIYRKVIHHHDRGYLFHNVIRPVFANTLWIVMSKISPYVIMTSCVWNKFY